MNPSEICWSILEEYIFNFSAEFHFPSNDRILKIYDVTLLHCDGDGGSVEVMIPNYVGG